MLKNNFQVDKACYINNSELKDKTGYQIAAIKKNYSKETKAAQRIPKLKESNSRSVKIR